MPAPYASSSSIVSGAPTAFRISTVQGIPGAQGIPGPQGATGPQGPQGPAGTGAILAAQRITFSSSSKQIVCMGQDQPVSVDTSGGAVTVLAPYGVTEGQRFHVVDVTGHWGTHAASVSVGAGVSIQNPANLGAYVTNGVLTLPMENGISYDFEWYATEGKWQLV